MFLTNQIQHPRIFVMIFCIYSPIDLKLLGHSKAVDFLVPLKLALMKSFGTQSRDFEFHLLLFYAKSILHVILRNLKSQA